MNRVWGVGNPILKSRGFKKGRRVSRTYVETPHIFFIFPIPESRGLDPFFGAKFFPTPRPKGAWSIVTSLTLATNHFLLSHIPIAQFAIFPILPPTPADRLDMIAVVLFVSYLFFSFDQ